MQREAEFVSYLQARFRAGRGVRVGIGDDAAVLTGDERHDWVVTTDLLIEGVHFLPRRQSAAALGWKALARSLSDIAAMGASPRYALVALGVPSVTPSRWVKDFFAGLGRLARRFRVKLAGGDLSSAPQVVVDVQVIGQVGRGRAVLRRGAQPGEVICVSGTLGLAALGLTALRRRVVVTHPILKQAVQAQTCPIPRLALAQALVRRGRVSAMIDLSDGLSSDLTRLCRASGVGARIYADRIPGVALPSSIRRRIRTDAMELALDGGEDYELLFVVPKAQASRLPKKLAGVKLTSVGEVTRERQRILVESSGRELPLAPRGWDHFRSG